MFLLHGLPTMRHCRKILQYFVCAQPSSRSKLRVSQVAEHIERHVEDVPLYDLVVIIIQIISDYISMAKLCIVTSLTTRSALSQFCEPILCSGFVDVFTFVNRCRVRSQSRLLPCAALLSRLCFKSCKPHERSSEFNGIA